MRSLRTVESIDSRITLIEFRAIDDNHDQLIAIGGQSCANTNLYEVDTLNNFSHPLVYNSNSRFNTAQFKEIPTLFSLFKYVNFFLF